MSGLELNGEFKVLSEHLEGKINQIVEMDRERWTAHDKFAEEFRQEVRTALEHRNKANGMDMKVLIGFASFLLTIIAFVAINLDTRLDYQQQELIRAEGRSVTADCKVEERIKTVVIGQDTKRDLEKERTNARFLRLERVGLMYTEKTLGDIKVLQQQIKYSCNDKATLP